MSNEECNGESKNIKLRSKEEKERGIACSFEVAVKDGNLPGILRENSSSGNTDRNIAARGAHENDTVYSTEVPISVRVPSARMNKTPQNF